MATCTSAPCSNRALIRAAETSASPPALAVKKEAISPIRSGKYVTSGVTTRMRGLLCECVMVSSYIGKTRTEKGFKIE